MKYPGKQTDSKEALSFPGLIFLYSAGIRILNTWQNGRRATLPLKDLQQKLREPFSCGYGTSQEWTVYNPSCTTYKKKDRRKKDLM